MRLAHGASPDALAWRLYPGCRGKTPRYERGSSAEDMDLECWRFYPPSERRHLTIRDRVTVRYPEELSHRMALRLSLRQASPVVPDPHIGSSTVSYSLVAIRIRGSITEMLATNRTVRFCSTRVVRFSWIGCGGSWGACGREARECGQGGGQRARVVHGLVHTARRARAGPQDSSTNPQPPAALSEPCPLGRAGRPRRRGGLPPGTHRVRSRRAGAARGTPPGARRGNDAPAPGP